MQVRTVALLALALLLADLPPAEASQADLDRARRRANVAAAALAEAQTRLSELEGRIADLEARQRENQRLLDSLGSGMRELAVAEFMRGGAAVVSVELDPTDASAASRAAALASIVSAGAADAVDAYRAVAEDHALAAERLAGSREAAAAAIANVRRRVAAANAELVKLQKLEAERVARERAQRRASASRRGGSAATRSSRSVIIGSGEWICPVQGPRAFTNDWGDPRGGGRRRHQGTDILSPRGTPVVAPVAGSARTHNSRVGGLSFYLSGADGHTYFGTHLQGYSGNTGRVAAGTVLGYVGNSGNASGGPTHLHFEIHPGGGGPVNPYPTLRQYC